MPAISSHRRPSAILWLSVAVALMSDVLANHSVSSTTTLLVLGSASALLYRQKVQSAKNNCFGNDKRVPECKTAKLTE